MNPFQSLLETISGPGSFDISGRVAVITGAGQGIGLELARILHHRGASVALLDIDQIKTQAAIEGWGDRASAFGVDVADRTAMADTIDAVRARFGRIDLLVANAGVAPAPATLRVMDPADFDRVLGINLTGVFNTVRPALEDIVAARGHVVVVSSCAAFTPGMGSSPYMISKAGVEQLGRALRIELAAHDATAGVAYFGVVETPMTHHSLDEDEIGRRAGELLPWPLNRRTTAVHAATVIADGIARRAPRTIAPRTWEPYALLRGTANVVLDRYLSVDPRVHALLGRLEQRIHGSQASDTVTASTRSSTRQS